MGDDFNDLRNATMQIAERVEKSQVIDDFYCISYDHTVNVHHYKKGDIQGWNEWI